MITIKGSYVGNRKDTSEAIDFFRRGLIKAPFKTIGMSELQKVYDLMRKSTNLWALKPSIPLLISLQTRVRLRADTWWILASKGSDRSSEVTTSRGG